MAACFIARTHRNGTIMDRQKDIEVELLNMLRNFELMREPGPQVTFAEMGGNSLLIIRLHMELSMTYSGLMTIQDIFDHPTVEQLARLIFERKSGKSSGYAVGDLHL